MQMTIATAPTMRWMPKGATRSIWQDGDGMDGADSQCVCEPWEAYSAELVGDCDDASGGEPGRRDLQQWRR